MSKLVSIPFEVCRGTHAEQKRVLLWGILLHNRYLNLYEELAYDTCIYNSIAYKERLGIVHTHFPTSTSMRLYCSHEDLVFDFFIK